MSEEWPSWLVEVGSRFAVSPHVVLAGNTRDLHLLRDDQRLLVSTEDALVTCLEDAGYLALVRWNVNDGVSIPWTRENGIEERLPVRADASPPETPEAAVGPLISAMTAVTHWGANGKQNGRLALLVDGAERLAPTGRDRAFHTVFVRAQQLCRRAQPGPAGCDDRAELYNAIFWLVDQEVSLPHWFVGTAGVHVVSVPEPELIAREDIAKALLASMRDYDTLGEAKEEVIHRFARRSAGMTAREMDDACKLAHDRAIPIAQIDTAVRELHTGPGTSPWKDHRVRQKILAAPQGLSNEILGQPHAIRQAVDVLARSAMGLSGVHTEDHPGRPQGILFLAGPTGVGKTALAKEIAKMVFGTSDSMIRFDMSEFSADHAQARLIGSPPGYVGHEDGGELTNAVRQRPFSLLLFDEIEKASVNLLKIFLGILEDGRLTDGSGSTVHFSETLIVFTSNLGVFELDEAGRPDTGKLRVKPGDDYLKIQQVVKDAIWQHFIGYIGMPELLNRIGLDNIVVFNFLPCENAVELLRRGLDRVIGQVREREGIDIKIGAPALRYLESQVCDKKNLAFGGRRVLDLVQSRFVDLLAYYLLPLGAGVTVEVENIVVGASGVPGLVVQVR